MKKILKFVRSMRFGMLLLLVILVLCFAGSMISQGGTEKQYISKYGENIANVILTLGLDHIFSTPFFIAVGIVLGLNLVDCSVTRFSATRKNSRAFLQRAHEAPPQYSCSPEKAEKLRKLLKEKGFKKSGMETTGDEVYAKYAMGHWGSFITHISILLILIVGSYVLYGAETQDLPVMPGTSEFLEDGTEIHVEVFRTMDSTSKTDYVSTMWMRLPDGTESGVKDVRVNEPLRLGKYKVYQQTYGRAGVMDLTNEETGVTDTAYLEEECFLTLDGKTGLYFQGIATDVIKDENGDILVSTSSGDYSHPTYLCSEVTENGMTSCLLVPGDEISVGGITFGIKETVQYPGLRVKELPPVALGLLYTVFCLIVIGLWLTFFASPVAVKITGSGFSVMSIRTQTGLMLALEEQGLLQKERNAGNQKNS